MPETECPHIVRDEKNEMRCRNKFCMRQGGACPLSRAGWQDSDEKVVAWSEPQTPAELTSDNYIG